MEDATRPVTAAATSPGPDRYGRVTYTRAQIEAYLDRIALPGPQRDHPVLQDLGAARDGPAALEFLGLLQRYQLAAVPFENLGLHYAADGTHPTVRVEAEAVFHKIVEGGRGRGGYCMENSCLFGTVLRSLGYEVYPTGARVNEAVQPMAASKSWPGPKYDGWNHMINIVTISGQKYFVDVGFGSSGPHHPIPLTEDYSAANVGTQSLRLQRTSPPDLLTTATTITRQSLWEYQFRHTDTSPWLPAYCFAETEFTPSDFAIMNHFTSTSRTSWFTYTVLCVKMLMRDGQLVGDVTLFGPEVKRRLGPGPSETLALLESEEQRVDALRRFLAVELTPEEQRGIRGTSTALS